MHEIGSMNWGSVNHIKEQKRQSEQNLKLEVISCKLRKPSEEHCCNLTENQNSLL